MIALKNGDYIDAGYIRAVFVDAKRNIGGSFSPDTVTVITSDGMHRSVFLDSYQSARDEAARISAAAAKAKEASA